MQNRYVGDVGDFAKHGLLRFLSGMTDPDDGKQLRVGLLWYMHHDEGHNLHGSHTGYLKPSPQNRDDYGACDTVLWDRLAHLLSQGDRCVHCAEEAGLLPEDTLFYDAQLHYLPKMSGEVRRSIRDHWFQTGLKATDGADLVCCDPDNGIAADKSMYRKNGPKFAYMTDLQALWERGQSLVVYQQMGMNQKGPQMVKEKSGLLRSGLENAEPIPLWFNKGSARVFFVIPQPQHKELIEERIGRFLQRWGQHFRRMG